MTVDHWLRPENRAVLEPGTISPLRPVPASIERPEYAFKDEAQSDNCGPYVQTPEVIERVRRASKIAAIALREAGKAAKPGVTTDEIDALVHEIILDHGAYPSTLGYLSFPKSCCTSLNEVVCHGIPDSTVMEEGDILNVDVTAYLDGVHGDTNATFPVGEIAPEAAELIERTEEAMFRGIRAAKVGREVNVVGRVIEKYVGRFGYDSVRDFTGHGVAEGFHNGLIIPHYDSAPHYDDVIEPNMIFTVEPMVTLGSRAWDQWDDGWTITTRDKGYTAQFEHTFLITDDGYEILTDPDAEISA
ncbi:type I methionyl aminopeptidase [Dermabacter vaginalis]|uniref:type I methionyl aminopeptidase n=1 Tax=Dermabacter vaginalis TaxID=1630135 RepID=UPI0021A534C1|nr:type I methionyl aminopeptidase [Dermabacter vaginalis]MCT2149744.1 type I methionyl aminopeptidase [Dermabacter vaginalis]